MVVAAIDEILENVVKKFKIKIAKKVKIDGQGFKVAKQNYLNTLLQIPLLNCKILYFLQLHKDYSKCTQDGRILMGPPVTDHYIYKSYISFVNVDCYNYYIQIYNLNLFVLKRYLVVI